MRKFYTAVVLLAFAAPSIAQTDSLKTLGEVVVTGQYKPQSVKNSVYQVRVISKEKILKTGATKLQDVFNNELNIRFSQDNATGGSGITMLGLRGQNVKIMIDGLPMTGRQGASNEIDINQIDVNSIERIEIVEGPMSVVYGADALAGVINIITKKANGSNLSVTARVHEETVGKEYGTQQGIHNQYASVAWRYKKLEIGGGIGYNYFGGFRGDSTNRELTWHWKDQITGNGYIAFNGTKFNIRYRFDGLDEIITNPGNFSRYQDDADDYFAPDQEYMSRRLMQQLQASYFANNKLSFQVQSAYTKYNRTVSSTIVSQKTGRVSLDPAAGSQSTVDFNGFTLRGTAQYKLSSWIYLQPGIDINVESGEGERLNEGNNRVEDYAFFLTSEITPVAGINIRPGLRVVRNSVYNAPPVIPSINTKFALTEKLDLRLAYARGFRSPSLRELYFNFFDANHQIVGNPDLKAETSNSLTGSLTWKTFNSKDATVALTLTGFYNKVKNLIDYAVSSTNSNLFILTNVSNSRTAGGTLNATAIFDKLTASLGFAYTGFYNDYAEANKSLPELQWSPEINSSLSYSFSKIGLDANLFYKFTGKRPFYVSSGPDYLLSKRNSYNWADLTLNKKLFKFFTINAGVRNLFDVKGVNSQVTGSSVHGSNGVLNIGYGRSYFAGLAFNWNKNN